MLSATAGRRTGRPPAARRAVRAAVRIFAVLVICAPAVLPVYAPAAQASAPGQRWLARLVIDYIAAQTVTQGQGVTIAVLDSGVDPHLRAPKGALLPEKDFVHLSSPKPVNGTLIASLLLGEGAILSSAKKSAGLVPKAKILPVRMRPDVDEPGSHRWYDRKNPTDMVRRAIRYAADHGAGVILVDEEIPDEYSVKLQEAVDYARTKNAVVVAPDVNLPETVAPMPASITGVIGVAGLGSNGRRWAKYSGKNSTALVAAPALKQAAVGPGNRDYEIWSTTPAAAWVAAAVAMVKSRFPRLTPAQVTQAISVSARHPKGGYNTEVGFGTIDPAGALKEAAKIQRRPEAPTATRGIVADDAHFAHGRVRIEAVRHSAGRLAGFGALMAAGLAALVAAGILLLRGRRLAPAPAGDAPGDGPPLPPEPDGTVLPPEADGTAREAETTGAPHTPETAGNAVPVETDGTAREAETIGAPHAPETDGDVPPPETADAARPPGTEGDAEIVSAAETAETARSTKSAGDDPAPAV